MLHWIESRILLGSIQRGKLEALLDQQLLPLNEQRRNLHLDTTTYSPQTRFVNVNLSTCNTLWSNNSTRDATDNSFEVKRCLCVCIRMYVYVYFCHHLHCCCTVDYILLCFHFMGGSTCLWNVHCCFVYQWRDSFAMRSYCHEAVNTHIM